jgi:rare lipoprotein A
VVITAQKVFRSTAYALLLFLLLTGPACRLTPWGNKTEKGVASWYGDPYHGRKTASGEIYDQWALTAAHRKLPFGTIVRVRNMDNRREVDVRINDRGPFVRGRIIDVSRAAAGRLGMINDGVVPVQIEVLRRGDG